MWGGGGLAAARWWGGANRAGLIILSFFGFVCHSVYFWTLIFRLTVPLIFIPSFPPPSAGHFNERLHNRCFSQTASSNRIRTFWMFSHLDVFRPEVSICWSSSHIRRVDTCGASMRLIRGAEVSFWRWSLTLSVHVHWHTIGSMFAVVLFTTTLNRLRRRSNLNLWSELVHQNQVGSIHQQNPPALSLCPCWIWARMTLETCDRADKSLSSCAEIWGCGCNPGGFVPPTPSVRISLGG